MTEGRGSQIHSKSQPCITLSARDTSICRAKFVTYYRCDYNLRIRIHMYLARRRGGGSVALSKFLLRSTSPLLPHLSPSFAFHSLYCVPVDLYLGLGELDLHRTDASCAFVREVLGLGFDFLVFNVQSRIE
jgi:hypothetical protein